MERVKALCFSELEPEFMVTGGDKGGCVFIQSMPMDKVRFAVGGGTLEMVGDPEKVKHDKRGKKGGTISNLKVV